MKYKLFIVVTFLLYVSIQSPAQSGYHYRGKYIPLVPDTSAIYFVQPRASQSIKISTEKILSSHLGNSNRKIQKVSDDRFYVTRQRIENDRLYVSDIYNDNRGNKCVIVPRIAVGLKHGAGIDNILRNYPNLAVIKHDGNVYRLGCDVMTSGDVLDINAKLEKEEGILWCEPIKRSGFLTNNPLYSNQYYLKNTGQNGGTTGIDINVEKAWEIASGNPNITVAVIDQGIDSIHEDMSGLILSGYTIRNATGYGMPQNADDNDCKGHGVACAGIIGAKDNSIGIKGIASGIKILPVNIVPDYSTIDYYGRIHQGAGDDDEIADAITWAYQRADVLSCSWVCSESELISQAIYNARTLGRNGKGCVVVCSSGNYYEGYNQISVKFPANLSGNIAVGAVDNTGTVWNYSCRGSELDLVAPSGDGDSNSDIVTTDRPGNLGYNTNSSINDFTDKNYTQKFSGTSAACPQVAGVAALMLSVRPDLTEAQVRTTLQSTARDLGTTGFDTTYGYGLVDAFAAVNAVAPKVIGSSALCDSAIYYVNNLPDGATVSWNLSINGSGSLATLSIDTPTSNQCRISRTDSQYESFTATLTATIIYQNDTITVLSKEINAPALFVSVPYTLINTQGSGGTGGMVGSYNNIDIKPNTLYFLSSLYLVGKTLSIQDSPIPGSYMFTPSGISGYNVMVPQGGNLIATFTDGCTSTTWSFWGRNSAYLMSVSGGDGHLDIEITQNDFADLEVTGNGSIMESTGNLVDLEWILEVYEANSFRKVKTVDVRGSSYTLDTSSLPKGIYIIRAIIGKEILSEKITVK